jgi:hypothetical protein
MLKVKKMKTINTERRKFFTKFGIGTLSAGIVSLIPVKHFTASKAEQKHSKSSVTVRINPMAVKRTSK